MVMPAGLAHVPHAANAPRSVSILGATGSIGASTADLLQADPQSYRVEALVAGRDAQALARRARELGARIAVICDPEGYDTLRDALAGSGIEAAAGEAAALEAAARPVDWTMAAISGTAGLRPALAALRRGGALALANKECLVCAGKAFLGEAARTGAEVLPVDSEHNAVAQALGPGRVDDVTRITLTASGGPFRQASKAEMERVTPEQALKHPTWSMGRKITIDSATLMNKGLELIEAHHLFGVDAARLDVLIHPQSVVHGLVSWRDGAVTAGLAPADMRVPIAHCLAWPARIDTDIRPLDLARIGTLSFEEVDHVRFPAVTLAQDALRQSGGAPTVLNAANEVAVAAFLAGELPFLGIVRLVAGMLEEAVRQGLAREPASVEEALELDAEVRRAARSHLPAVALRAH